MEQPHFVIRKASETDLKGIMDIMGEAKASLFILNGLWTTTKNM